MRAMPQVVPTDDREWRILLVVCTIGAGLIHAAVAPEDLEEDRVFGAFFTLVAGLQILWAIPIAHRICR
jgi:hypothetical protein